MANSTLECALKSLQEKFGFSEFKSTLQQDAVLAVIQGI